MKISILGLVLLLVYGVARGVGIDDFLRWRLIGQKGSPDGGTLTTLALESPREGLPWERLEIVYRSFSRRGPPEIYRKNVTPNQSEIELYSGHPEKIELNARAEKDGVAYYARSIVFAYGDSGRSDPGSERLDSTPSWPGFSVASERFYRAQAGSELTLQTDARPEHVEIYENGSLVSTPTPNDAGYYSYTPPHDPKLLKSWRSAWKSLVFAAELPRRRIRFSFYLPVYRAYYGQVDYRGGLAVLAVAMLAALAWVGWRGRKFQWR
ncbi:MAG: hypothetical protein LBU46_04175 [Candidatus Accumulibacter sp.]|nr:hypothetical protein [Accumulibacter sp.]